MASVRKRKWTHNGEQKDAWVCEYTDLTGTRRRKTFDKKKDADTFRQKVEREVADGVHIAESQTATVKEACELFIRHAEQRVNEGRLGKSRHNSFRTIVDKYMVPHFGAKLISDFTWSDANDWHSWLLKQGLSPITAKHYLVVGKQIEDYARKRGLTKQRCIAEYCREVRGVKAKTIRTFTVEQVATLLKTAEVRPPNFRPRSSLFLRCAVNLAAFCGLRYGEIIGLTMESIDLEGRIIHVRNSLTRWDVLKGPKTAAGNRDVPMPQHLAIMLAEWREKYYFENDRKLLFRISGTNKPFDATSFHENYWKPLLKRAGLHDGTADPFHFHALRHFAASFMIELGLPLTDVASLLGHNTFDMTLQVYAHPVVGGNRRHDAIERMASSIAIVDATQERQGGVSV